MNNTIALSDTTLKLLRNLSTINKGLLFTKDGLLSSINETDTVQCSVKVEEKIPVEFAVYNLKNLLDTLTLCDTPELELEEKHLIIKDLNNEDLSIRYGYCNKSLINSPFNKKMKLPPEEVPFSFDLNYEDLHMCLRASNKLNLPCISIVGRNGSLILEVSDTNPDETKRISHNSFTKVIGNASNYFSLNFDVKKMNLLKDDYKVNISVRQVAHFKSKNYKCEYLIGANVGSSFDG